MVTSDFRPEVEIRPVRACAMHPAIITGAVRSLWMWLWGRPQTPRSTERISSYKGNYYYYYYYSACIRNADFNYHYQLSLMTHN